ncbi:hypothetical protein EJ03DRAFT_356947 [Teratosphaeria nubilosa]|uniref:Uncharacterized protein n=1 Tax=Teratosphaeria nubilosa TaxID=161662 RepID=A0A6G1LPI8_9PEZI|nr:hypothetical protein EJ03DRAFT_356947 [Teratosphaeria nubilosa]
MFAAMGLSTGSSSPSKHTVYRYTNQDTTKPSPQHNTTMASNHDQKMYSTKHFTSQVRQHLLTYQEDLATSEVKSLPSQPDSAYAPPPPPPTNTCTCGPTHRRTASPSTTACRFVPAAASAPTGYALCTEAQAFARWYDAGFTAIHLPYNQGVAFPPDKNHPFTKALAEEGLRWRKYRSGRMRLEREAREPEEDEADVRWLLEQRAKRLSGELEREYEALVSGRESWVAAVPGGLSQDLLEEEARQRALVAAETASEGAAEFGGAALRARRGELERVEGLLLRRYESRMRWWQWAEDEGMVRYGEDEALEGPGNFVVDFVGGRRRCTGLCEWLGFE